MQSDLTKVLETSGTVVDGRRASIPELVVVPARSSDLVEAPDMFRTSKELDRVHKGILAKCGQLFLLWLQYFGR